MAGCYAIEVFELFDEMRLVVIARIKEQFILPQALYRWLSAQYVLKPYHLAECFGRCAYIMIK